MVNGFCFADLYALEALSAYRTAEAPLRFRDCHLFSEATFDFAKFSSSFRCGLFWHLLPGLFLHLLPELGDLFLFDFTAGLEILTP